MTPDYRIGTAKLLVMEALHDLDASSREKAITTKELDDEAGDFSRFTYRSATKILQEMLRDGTIEMTFDDPMTIWLTPKGLRDFMEE